MGGMESNVILLSDMVTADDLKDDEEYQEIVDDIREECSKFGVVKSMTIPRPAGENVMVPGLGKVFVEMETVDQAKVAIKELSGRTFENGHVVASYFSEDKYAN